MNAMPFRSTYVSMKSAILCLLVCGATLREPLRQQIALNQSHKPRSIIRKKKKATRGGYVMSVSILLCCLIFFWCELQSVPCEKVMGLLSLKSVELELVTSRKWPKLTKEAKES